MGFSNRLQSNFARGEISPDTQSRDDIDVFHAAVKLARNFIPKFQGVMKYAPGTTYIDESTFVALGSEPLLIPFVYRDTQAYHIQLTIDAFGDIQIMMLNDDGVMLHIAGSTGWEINDAGGSSDSELVGYPSTVGKDPDVFTNGAPGVEVKMTLAGSYAVPDMSKVRWAQSGAAMVIILEGSFCIQVWRGASSEAAWAINVAKIETSGGDAIENVLGVTEDATGLAEFFLAGNHVMEVGSVAVIKNTGDDANYDGAFNVVSTADATHFVTTQEFIGFNGTTTDSARKGGNFFNFRFKFDGITDFLTDPLDIPKEVKFHEGRLYFVKDDKMYGSRSVVDGVDMYTNFVQALTPLPTDAIEFTASISSDKVDLFKWLKVSDKTFYGGMENLISIIQGNTFDDPIAGDSIRMSSAEDRGSSDVPPLEDGKDIIFVGSTGKTLNAFKYSVSTDSERSSILTLLSEHMFSSTVKRIVFQRGLTDIIWVLLADGKLLGFIFNSVENITGWFRYEDANGDTFIDISVLPISNGVDRLWLIVERPDDTLGTVKHIEQLNLETDFSKFEDFYTGEDNKVEDTRRWKNAVFEEQKTSVHMHSTLSKNSFDITLAAGHYLHISQDLTEVFAATGIPAATKITGAGSPLSGEVDNQFVIKATTVGLGEGKYTIDDYTSGTGISNVTQVVELADFEYNVTQSAFIIPPGFWGISFSTITSSSFQRFFESTGADIDAVLDGSFVDDLQIVKDGSDYIVDLNDNDTTVAYFGYRFRGVLATLPINVGGVSGTAFSKLKNMDNVRVDFIDTVNFKYGVDPYNLSETNFEEESDIDDRPPPPFTGTRELPNINGGWGEKKSLFIVQDIPLPLTIAAIDISGEAVDEI